MSQNEYSIEDQILIMKMIWILPIEINDSSRNTKMLKYSSDISRKCFTLFEKSEFCFG